MISFRNYNMNWGSSTIRPLSELVYFLGLMYRVTPFGIILCGPVSSRSGSLSRKLCWAL